MDKVYEKGYVYHGDQAYLRFLSNNGVYAKHPSRGNVYVTFDKYSKPSDARSQLQLLPEFNNSAQYRFDFSTLHIKDKTRLARGRGDTEEYFEYLAKDYTSPGYPGGGKQALVEDDILVDAVYLIDEAGNETKVWDKVIGIGPF
jgi:hypothetical protein